MRFLITAFAAMAFSSVAHAHYLWIEPAGDVLMVRFGEIQEKVRETEEGHLKSVAGPTATLAKDGAFKAVELKRVKDGFAFPSSGMGATIAEGGFGVMDRSKSGKGFSKLEYFARFTDATARPTPTQVLDIVPTDNNKVRLTLNGKPVPDSKITFVGLDLAEVPLTTDTNGEAAVPISGAGLYVVDAMVTDASTGTFKDKAYDSKLYRSTLAILKR
ncbi:MAG: hypothetical protein JNM81_04340 [Rhodospirillaceae bacterium]|nr:hypothetical protein [Rhodospirillaceae bacterium]